MASNDPRQNDHHTGATSPRRPLSPVTRQGFAKVAKRLRQLQATLPSLEVSLHIQPPRRDRQCLLVLAHLSPNLWLVLVHRRLNVSLPKLWRFHM